MKILNIICLMPALVINNHYFAVEAANGSGTNVMGHNAELGSESANSGESYKVRFLAEVTSSWGQNQGKQIKTCEACWTSNSCIIRQDIAYEHDPVNNKNADRVDFDKNGNFIQWRPSRIDVIFDTKRNDMRMESSSYTITPAGNIIRTNTLSQLFHYKIGDHSSISLLDQFRLATGNCFDQYVYVPRKASSELVDKEKLDGNFGASLRGVWTITRDINRTEMIREANFIAQGTTSPLVIVSNSGLLECPGIAIAASGSFTSGPYIAQFQTLECHKVDPARLPASKFYQDVINYLGSTLPENMPEIVDLLGEKVERIAVTNSNEKVTK